MEYAYGFSPSVYDSAHFSVQMRVASVMFAICSPIGGFGFFLVFLNTQPVAYRKLLELYGQNSVVQFISKRVGLRLTLSTEASMRVEATSNTSSSGQAAGTVCSSSMGGSIMSGYQVRHSFRSSSSSNASRSSNTDSGPTTATYRDSCRGSHSRGSTCTGTKDGADSSSSTVKSSQQRNPLHADRVRESNDGTDATTTTATPAERPPSLVHVGGTQQKSQLSTALRVSGRHAPFPSAADARGSSFKHTAPREDSSLSGNNSFANSSHSGSRMLQWSSDVQAAADRPTLRDSDLPTGDFGSFEIEGGAAFDFDGARFDATATAGSRDDSIDEDALMQLVERVHSSEQRQRSRFFSNTLSLLLSAASSNSRSGGGGAAAGAVTGDSTSSLSRSARFGPRTNTYGPSRTHSANSSGGGGAPAASITRAISEL